MDFPKSVPGVGLVGGQFVDENQATGQVGSLIPSKWGNDVTTELLGVIEEGDLVPDEENPQQVRAAVRAIVNKVAPIATENQEEEGTDNAARMTPLRVAQAIQRRMPADAAVFQYDYFGGLTLANNAATPSTDIDISPGAARAANNGASILLGSALTKRLQSAGGWTSGAGGNGLFSGVRAANTWYHIFLIRRDSDGAVDAGFDTSVSADNRPAGYGDYRRLGSIRTDAAGAVIGFTNTGDVFRWKSPTVDVSVVSIASATPYAIKVPPGVRVLAKVGIQGDGGDFRYFASEVDAGALPDSMYYGVLTGSTDDRGGQDHHIVTNLSGQILLKSPDAGAFNVSTLGWTEIGR